MTAAARIPPEVDRAIGLVAEARMLLMLLVATRGASAVRPPNDRPEFVQERDRLERATRAARAHVEGLTWDPAFHRLAVELRVCELAVERLGGAAAPAVAWQGTE